MADVSEQVVRLKPWVSKAYGVTQPFYDLKRFCTIKETMNEVKRQPTG